MSQAFQCGHLSFKTKKAATEHFKSMLSRYCDDEIVSPSDLRDLLALLECHPERDQKIGRGVFGIQVCKNPDFPSTRCFWIYRVDGTDTDFSYLSCIKKAGPSLRQEFMNACRREIAQQVIEFKQVAFAGSQCVTCPESGDVLTWDSCHVDHVIPFVALVDQFIKESGIAVSRSLISILRDNQSSATFSCVATAEAWRKFHAARAVLRVVSVQFNLSRNRTES